MKKRIVSLLLACILSLTLLPFSTLAAEDQPTEEEIAQGIAALKEKYPEDTIISSFMEQDYQGRYPYTWAYSTFMDVGYGNEGMLYKFSDILFGTGKLPPKKVEPVEFSDVRVGDLLRLNNDHYTAMVTEVNENGVSILDCSYEFIAPKVRWERTLNKAEVENADYLITRYPYEKPEPVVEPDTDGHYWGEWVITQPATCISTGIKTRTCSHCGKTETESTPLACHTISIGTCIYCKERLSIFDENGIMQDGHTWTPGKVLKKATCSEYGQQQFVCSECGTTKVVEFDNADHDFVDGVCTQCGVASVDEYKNLCQEGHFWGDWTVLKESTCTTVGLKVRYCKQCNKEWKRPIPLAHEYHLGYCIKCGAPEETEHDWGDWYVETPSNCAFHGREMRTCSQCGEVEYQSLPLSSEHHYVNGFCTCCDEYDVNYDFTADQEQEEEPEKTAEDVTQPEETTEDVTQPEETAEDVTQPEVHFVPVTVYTVGQFSDVKTNQWFNASVSSAVQLGLMKGNGNGSFNPGGDVTLAETITMAARIHSIYTTGKDGFEQTDVWYQCYLDYAYEQGIIPLSYYTGNVNQKATRMQFAEIFAQALPEEALPAVNSVADNAIPDVKSSDSHASSVYTLYRAGILIGGNQQGAFFPDTNITRAECATIVSRMADSDNRVSVTLDK